MPPNITRLLLRVATTLRDKENDVYEDLVWQSPRSISSAPMLENPPGNSIAQALRFSLNETEPARSAAGFNQTEFGERPVFRRVAAAAPSDPGDNSDTDESEGLFAIRLSREASRATTPLTASSLGSPTWASTPLPQLKARVADISGTSAATAHALEKSMTSGALKNIGKGSSGRVFVVPLTNESGVRDQAAVKVFVAKNELAGLHEARIFSAVAKKRKEKNQDHLVHFLGAAAVQQKGQTQILVAMDYIEGHNIKHLGKKMKLLNDGDRIIIAKQIAREMASGVCALLDAGMVHNDPKEDNFICDKNTHRIMTVDYSNTDTIGALKSVGHPFYSGPERVSANGSIQIEHVRQYQEQRPHIRRDEKMEELLAAYTLNEKTDSFGFGQMIHNMVTGRRFLSLDIDQDLNLRPGYDHRGDDVHGLETGTMLAMDKLLRRGVIYRPEDQHNETFKQAGFYDFINCAMHPDITQRLSMHELRQHPFLQDGMENQEGMLHGFETISPVQARATM